MALAALLFIFWGQPTAAVVLLIAVLLLVALGLTEVSAGHTPGQAQRYTLRPGEPRPHTNRGPG